MSLGEICDPKERSLGVTHHGFRVTVFTRRPSAVTKKRFRLYKKRVCIEARQGQFELGKGHENIVKISDVHSIICAY